MTVANETAPHLLFSYAEDRCEGDLKMSAKSITLNRSAAVRLQDRKHPQRYKEEEEESKTNEEHQRVLDSSEVQLADEKVAA